jgi:hypothetical protein
MLPMGLTGICRICDWCLLCRARYFQEEILPASFTCLDMNALAEARPVLKAAETEKLLRYLYGRKMPGSLRGRMQLIEIEIFDQPVAPDPDHWLGDRQPRTKPVVVMRSRFTDYQGQPVDLRAAIEIMSG